MTTKTETTVMQRVRHLHEYIAEGRILEALHEVYADDVVMQENLEAPCRGLAANVEREKAWHRGIAVWKGFEVKALAVDGDTSFAETSMDFVAVDGTAVHLEQVARATWRDGRIVAERFYHS
jgi:ketosteroid isomerase-like protein